MTKYFIKPIGTSKNGDSWDDTKPAPCGPDSTEDFVCFAKNPKAVSIGDLLIIYAVGNKQKIVGVYEVTSGLTSDKYQNREGNRWDYAVKVKLLSKDFSRNWAKNSVTLGDIVDKYKEIFKANVTLYKRDLNGLKFGSDKVQVEKEFAGFLIGKIV